MKKERKKETLKIMKAAGIAGIAGVGIAAGGLMSANSVYAATEKQANTDTAVSRDQVTVKDQTAESTDESKSVEANASENVSKNAFDENLKNMADAGQKAIDFSQNSLSDIENLRAANETIQAGTLGNGDILSLSLSSNILKNDWTAGDFNEINNLLTGLINGNTNHVNILVNVKIRASDLSGDELKNLNAMMNGVNNYDCRASYLTSTTRD